MKDSHDDVGLLERIRGYANDLLNRDEKGDGKRGRTVLMKVFLAAVDTQEGDRNDILDRLKDVANSWLNSDNDSGSKQQGKTHVQQSHQRVFFSP